LFADHYWKRQKTKDKINKMNIIESIIERAKADKQRIVLPEGTEKGRFRQPISCCATALPRLSCWEIPVKLMHWQSNSNLKTFRKHES